MNHKPFAFGYRFSCASTLAALCVSLSACSGGAGDANGSGASAGDAGQAQTAGNGNAGIGNSSDTDKAGGSNSGAGADNGGSGNAGGGNGACAGDPVCASLNGLGVDTSKTPRVGPSGGELPASFNPFGGKVTALFPKEELYIGGLTLGSTANNSAIVERHADLPQDPANNVMFQAAEAWTQAPLHAAVAGDFDGDGRQEIAGLYVKNGALMLHSIGSEKSAFATADVTLGTYEVSAFGAVAGDFDGDGRDEIAIAVAQTAGTQVLFAEDESSLFKINPKLSQSIPRETAGATLSYRLAAGNLDYDGAKELVLVANEVEGDFQDGKASAHYYVYEDQNGGFAPLKDGIVQGKDGALYSALLASPAVVDVDADGVGEVVLAGLVSHESSQPVELILIALDDSAHQFAPVATKHTIDYRDITSDGSGEQRYENVIVNGLDFDGDLAQDIQVNQVVFSNFSKSAAPFSKLFEINAAEFQSKQGFRFRADNAAMAVGDMNGDKHDDIVALSPDRDAVFIWGFQGLDAAKKPTYGKIDSIPVKQTDMDSHDYPMLVPVNVDDDTSLLEFSEAKSDFVFTEPVIIAAVAAPPCQNDVGQNLDVCQTSFGTAKTEQVSKENSVTLSASVTVGVSFEDRTFTQSALDIEATATVAATRTRGTAYTVEKSVTFSTGSMEDAVVFTTIPYDRYSYKIISDPHPELVGSTTTISVPREPITLMVERSFYNAHVAPGSIKIDDAVFKHTVGEVASYPTLADKKQLLTQYGGIESDEKTSGQGTGQTAVGLSVSNEISSGSELELGYEMSVSLTAGGVMGGFKVGGSVSDNLTVVSGKSTSYGGVVGSIDASHFAQSKYNFGLFTYPYKAPSGAQFEVLNYWVK